MENLNEQLMEAAMRADLDAVKKLVSQGADINYRDKWGNTAIFSAAWNGDVKALEMFHSLGADLHQSYANLLCNAAFNAQVESVKWLLQKNADPNFTFDNGENALHYTISQTNKMSERTDIVRILIDSGTDINKKTIPGTETLCFMRDAFLKGETPLHRAAAYGEEMLIQLLLNAGADPSVKDANGDTPISWGSWHLRPSSVLRLLTYGNVRI